MLHSADRIHDFELEYIIIREKKRTRNSNTRLLSIYYYDQIVTKIY